MNKRIAGRIPVAVILALAAGCQTPNGKDLPRARGGIGREDLTRVGSITVYSQDGMSCYVQRRATHGQGLSRGACKATAPVLEDPRGIIFAPVTLIGGGVVGLCMGASAEKTTQAVSTLTNALAQADMSAAFARQLAALAQNRETVRVRTGIWPQAEVASGNTVDLNGVQTALLVRVDQVDLVDGTEAEPIKPINPRLMLRCSWSAEFRDIPSGATVRCVSGHYKFPHRKRLYAWSAGDARDFRAALETSQERIAAEAAGKLLGLQFEASQKTAAATRRGQQSLRVRSVVEDLTPRFDSLYIAPVQLDPGLQVENDDSRAALEKATSEFPERLRESFREKELFSEIRVSPPGPEKRRRCLQLDCTISWVPHGRSKERVLVRGQLSSTETGQRVLEFEADAQRNWLTRGAYKKSPAEKDQRELAKRVGALLEELAAGRLSVS